MNLETTERGFEVVTHPVYPPEKEERSERLVQQSSIIGKYEDAFRRPGSSALWIGEHHHLNREEVAELTARLVNWLKTGRLFIDTTAGFGKIARSVLGQGGAGGAASPPAGATKSAQRRCVDCGGTGAVEVDGIDHVCTSCMGTGVVQL